MEKEENVCVETFGTEQEVKKNGETVGRDGAQENGSAVPEKFKDVDALARAYGSLQAEFTRRSQRLRELEKIADNFKSEEGDVEGSGVEKLRKIATARRLAAKEFDRFVADTCALKRENNGEKTEEKPVELDALSNGAAMVADAEIDEGTQNVQMAEKNENGAPSGAMLDGGFGENGAHSSVAVSDNDVLDSEKLYSRVCRDENVRLRIIGEYLSSIGKSGAPLTTGGVGVMTTPPLRAKNISDAGLMALQYFKKPAKID